jgi:hypothetical protein
MVASRKRANIDTFQKQFTIEETKGKVSAWSSDPETVFVTAGVADPETVFVAAGVADPETVFVAAGVAS